jgi:hypothetical protein
MLTLKGLDVSVLIISPFDSIVGSVGIKVGHENAKLEVGLDKMERLEPTGDARILMYATLRFCFGCRHKLTSLRRAH